MGVPKGVAGGVGRPLWVLKGHREHRSALGKTEAQPSEGVHAAHRDPVLPLTLCQDTGVKDKLLEQPAAGMVLEDGSSRLKPSAHCAPEGE